MIISFLNIKGGVGKTTLAANLALYKKNALIETNEKWSPLKVLFQDRCNIVSKDDSFYMKGDFVIIDLAGAIDPRINSVLLKSDIIVIPVSLYSSLDRLVTMDTLEAADKHKRKIRVVFNRFQKSDPLQIDRLKRSLEAESINYSYLRDSKAFIRSMEQRQNLDVLSYKYPLFRKHYQKAANEFRDLFNQIDL